MLLKGKKILIGISGGIAAYKICELVRLFIKSDAEVRVIMTPSAVNFVSPITLSTLSGNEVLINIFPEVSPESTEKVSTGTWHIESGIWPDIFIIAPATANTLAKIAHGFCDNFLTATVLASRCPVLLAPSMDVDMYKNEITRQNLSKLSDRGFIILEPDKGELASGLYGIGRMPEPQFIFDYSCDFLLKSNKDLKGEKILITAGPTYEPIDDVRYIGNYSSGKMGFQIAKAASLRGADVTLISGPSHLETPKNVKRIDVHTSDEMFDTVMNHSKNSGCIIMAAAVSDFKPKNVIKGKIKKENEDGYTLITEKTKDILEHLGKNKKYKLVGFALETVNEIPNGKRKIKNKNLDLVVVNNPNVEGAGFGADTNVVTLIDKKMKVQKLKKMSKFDIANIILDKIKNL